MNKKIELIFKKYTRPASDLTLSRIKLLLNLLGNPEKNLKFIHVAGTNGKGSVCTMLSYILKNSGYKTGLYTSPHIINFRERFKINNKMVSNLDLLNILKEIAPKILNLINEKNISLTEFELTTVIAFFYFYKNKCDIVILETGLGGRLDATNAIDTPLFSVITSLSLDHTNTLGNTLEKIALEKAGIIKKNKPVICGPNIEFNALNVIKNVAKAKYSEVVIAKNNNIKILKETFFSTVFKRNEKIFNLNLAGRHQIDNVSTVFECVNLLNKLGYKIAENSIFKSLSEVRHPARLEILGKEPLIILDGAHNKAGIDALYQYILMHFGGKRIIGIFAMLKNKYTGDSLAKILPLFSSLIVLEIKNNERSYSPEEIYSLAKKYNRNVIYKSSVAEALSLVYYTANKEDIVIIFGSLYLAGNIRNQIFGKQNKTS